MRPTEVANNVLDVLKNLSNEKPGFSMKTWSLWQRADVEQYGVNQTECRNILYRLQTAGVVQRTGARKYYWRLIVPTWDRANPFAKQNSLADSPPISPKIDYTEIKPKPENFFEKLVIPPIKPPEKPEDTSFLRGAITTLTQQVKDLIEHTEDLEAKIEEVERIKNSHIKVLEIKYHNGTTKKIKDVILPEIYQDVLDLAECRRNILIVGPTGCGKTWLAELIANTLNLRYGSMSCTSGMSEAHLLGRTVPNLMKGRNIFVGAGFLDCYEKGGVYLLDEVDASDSNLLLALNTALSNRYCNVPNRRKKPRADQHDDFICIATANTYGRGADRVYVGRNQLDEATIERFRMGTVVMGYDLVVEKALCPDDDLRTELQRIRTRIEQSGVRRIVSTRFLQDAHIMRKKKDWSVEKIKKVLFQGWTKEEVAKVS